MKNSTILKASAAPIALGLALSSAPAFAQDSEAGAQAQTGQTIVVTGSRIQNPNLENASPVAVVTSEELGLQQATVFFLVADNLRRDIAAVEGVAHSA